MDISYEKGRDEKKMKMIFLSRCTRLLLFLILFKKYLFIYYFIIFGCAGSLVLCRLSLVAARAAYSLVVLRKLLIVVASLVGEHGLWRT